MVLWVSLQYVIVVFPDHTHLLFAIILPRKRKLVAQLLLSVNVMWLFLTVPWVGLQLVIVVLPDPTHLHFGLLPVIVVDNIYRNISKNRK